MDNQKTLMFAFSLLFTSILFSSFASGLMVEDCPNYLTPKGTIQCTGGQHGNVGDEVCMNNKDNTKACYSQCRCDDDGNGNTTCYWWSRPCESGKCHNDTTCAPVANTRIDAFGDHRRTYSFGFKIH